MTTSVLDMKLTLLLNIANRIQSCLSNKSDTDDIAKEVLKAINEEDTLIAHDAIASENYKFMIISSDPIKVFDKILESLKQKNSKKFQETLNPITIITKLIDREYIFNAAGMGICYGIKATVPSNYLMKSFACRTIASVRSYYEFVDEQTSIIHKEKIEELHPLYDYRTNGHKVIGAKKQIKYIKQKQKENVRLTIISRLIEYVRGNKTIASGLIFINDLDECSSSAINIIYTQNKFKDAIIDYLKLLVADSFKSYTFKTFLHADFNIPYDFRMKKHSSLINDKTTNQATYLANFYNNATYEPIPCIKSIIHETFIQIPHPIVKLRILYIDMFMIEHKTGSVHPLNYEKLYQNKMLKAFNDVQTFDKCPSWVGFYIDETYDKNTYNNKMKLSNAFRTEFI